MTKRRGLLAFGLVVLSSFSLAGSEDLAKGVELYDRADWMGALPYFERAAEKGEAEAQKRLGYILWKGGADLELAGSWLRKAAQAGDAQGQVFYSIFLVENFPSDADKSKESTQWLSQAADQKYPRAMVSLARKLEGEQPQRSLELYRELAQMGRLDAINRLIKAYRGDELGLQADPQEIKRLEAMLP